MSHIPQRKENDCLNCGATVQGKFCHECGQQNVEPKETFWHMVTHFFYDITHFDSSFFITIKDLLFKPGFLSKEYMKGRRASYLHPVRMYVFTSAFFFLLFFSFFYNKKSIEVNIEPRVTEIQRTAYIDQLEKKLKQDTGNKWLKERILFAKDTTHSLGVTDILQVEEKSRGGISFTDTKYDSFEEYDSVQKTLLPSKRDGWFERRLVKIDINLKKKIRENPDEALKKFVDSVLHRLPYMLLISLPFFALILKIAYIRRKHFYYADHGVFAIHLYVFSFLLLLLVFVLSSLQNIRHLDFIDITIFLLFLLLLFYLYKGMRTFYGQGRWKTFFKFLFVAFISLVMMITLLVFFMLFTAVTF